MNKFQFFNKYSDDLTEYYFINLGDRFKILKLNKEAKVIIELTIDKITKVPIDVYSKVLTNEVKQKIKLKYKKQ